MTDIEKLKARVEEFEYTWGDEFGEGFRHAIEILEQVETPAPNPTRTYRKGIRVYPCETCGGNGYAPLHDHKRAWVAQRVECDKCDGTGAHL